MPMAEAGPECTRRTMAEQPGQVKRFPQLYSEDMFRELERSLSPERMRTYLRAAGGDGE